MIHKNQPSRYFGITKLVIRLKMVVTVVHCFNSKLEACVGPDAQRLATSQTLDAYLLHE